MAAIDMSGYVADLKDHAAEHGFHIHDERHFVETYSLRQAWEVDLHPEEACGGPLDLHLTLEADPRTMLALEDVLLAGAEGELPPDEFWAQLTIWPVSAAKLCLSKCQLLILFPLLLMPRNGP